MFPGHAALTAVRLEAEIDVGMPLRDAQRNALVQLVLAHGSRRGIHRSLEFIAIPGFLVQDCGRFSRIKANLGHKSALLIGEMIMFWRSLWMKRSIAVAHSHSVIFVLGKSLSQSLNDLIGTPGILCVRRPQRRPLHVGPEMFLMRNHHIDSPLPMIMTIHIHALD